MSRIEPPSFSLGLDFDEESESGRCTEQPTTVATPTGSSSCCPPEENDEDLGPQVPDSEPEDEENPPQRVFKRLKKGPSARKRETEGLVRSPGDNDDIEEFSSQDEFVRGAPPSTQRHSVCSSSKVPFHVCGILKSQSSKKLNTNKTEDTSDASNSVGLETSHNGSVFPKLTVSPLRMFKLIDSDSDEPSLSEGVSRGASKRYSSSKELKPIESEQNRRVPAVMTQNNGLSGTSHCGSVLPKLTVSPLQKFKILNFDSENPSASRDVSRGANKSGLSSKRPQPVKSVQKRKTSVTPQDNDFWETSPTGPVFPKSTASPLQMFKLLDSDSDDSSVSKNVSGRANERYSSLKELQPNRSEQKRKASAVMPQNGDLWEAFCPKTSHIPTPALDDVCEEYFRSLTSKNAAQKPVSVGARDHNTCHPSAENFLNSEQSMDLAGSLPPAHHYFYHKDPRIQRLVRSRLPNFSPLGVVNNRREQSSSSVINYMSQFSSKEASKQEGSGKVNSKLCSRAKNKSRVSNEGWMDPKNGGTIPKDAGKRRVSANATSQSAGHWYTSPEGRKVYVSKAGKELTGQNAYRHYRKESGGGFKKSRKKNNTKNKKN